MAPHALARQDEDGFTLIELLVVIIIIGVLASIAVPSFLGQRSRAIQASMKSDLRNAAVNAESYWADAGSYVGFTGSDFFTSMRGSPDVSLTVQSASTVAMCMSASHPKEDPWYLRTDVYPQLSQTPC